jgi:hypothetical protein
MYINYKEEYVSIMFRADLTGRASDSTSVGVLLRPSQNGTHRMLTRHFRKHVILKPVKNSFIQSYSEVRKSCKYIIKSICYRFSTSNQISGHVIKNKLAHGRWGLKERKLTSNCGILISATSRGGLQKTHVSVPSHQFTLLPSFRNIAFTPLKHGEVEIIAEKQLKVKSRGRSET